MLKHTQLRLCLPALLYLGAPRSSSMATVRWADIYDNTDDDGLGPWAAYLGRPRSPSPPPQPPAREQACAGLISTMVRTTATWARGRTILQDPDRQALFPKTSGTRKKKDRGKKGKKKPWKHAKHASMFPDLVQEAIGGNPKGLKGNTQAILIM